jgi:hypothetical protein
MAIITMVIITIAILTICSGPNVDISAYQRCEVGSRFRWNILVSDLLTPRSECLPFMQNGGLQL